MIAPGEPTGVLENEYGVIKRFEKLSIYLNQAKYILDFGCGYGAYTKLLKQYGAVVVGVDLSQEYIFKAKHLHPELFFLKASGETLPFKNESFEIVCLIEVLEHVQNENSVLEEINRILTPGGRLLITVPNKFFPFETHSIKIGEKILEPPIPFFSWLPDCLRKPFERARIYNPKKIISLLRKHRFRVVTVDFIPPLFEGVFENIPGIKTLRNVADKIFNLPLIKLFSMSILAVAQKI